jgi:hypothetical protein
MPHSLRWKVMAKSITDLLWEKYCSGWKKKLKSMVYKASEQGLEFEAYSSDAGSLWCSWWSSIQRRYDGWPVFTACIQHILGDILYRCLSSILNWWMRPMVVRSWWQTSVIGRRICVRKSCKVHVRSAKDVFFFGLWMYEIWQSFCYLIMAHMIPSLMPLFIQQKSLRVVEM